jgi:hypothetical protein
MRSKAVSALKRVTDFSGELTGTGGLPGVRDMVPALRARARLAPSRAKTATDRKYRPAARHAGPTVSSVQPLATTIMSISPRVGAFYELLKKAPDYSALIMRGNHDCRHDTALSTTAAAAESNLMMRQEIYFRSPREHSPKHPGVYPDIQTGLLRSIIRNPSACGILAIRHRTLPSRLDARILVIAVRVLPSDDGVEDGQRTRRVQVGRPWRQDDPRQGRRAGLIGPAFGPASRLDPGPWRILGVSAPGCGPGTGPGCPGVRDG